MVNQVGGFDQLQGLLFKNMSFGDCFVSSVYLAGQVNYQGNFVANYRPICSEHLRIPRGWA